MRQSSFFDAPLPPPPPGKADAPPEPAPPPEDRKHWPPIVPEAGGDELTYALTALTNAQGHAAGARSTPEGEKAYKALEAAVNALEDRVRAMRFPR